MSNEKKSGTINGKKRPEKKNAGETYGGALPAKARSQCPKAAKDCSTCRITDCPEEEI